jgi:hypothetical protein
MLLLSLVITSVAASNTAQTLRRLQRAYHSTLDAVDPGRPRCLRRRDKGCPPPSAITDDHLRGVICNNDDDGNSESKEMQSRGLTKKRIKER